MTEMITIMAPLALVLQRSEPFEQSLTEEYP